MLEKRWMEDRKWVNFKKNLGNIDVWSPNEMMEEEKTDFQLPMAFNNFLEYNRNGTPVFCFILYFF